VDVTLALADTQLWPGLLFEVAAQAATWAKPPGPVRHKSALGTWTPGHAQQVKPFGFVSKGRRSNVHPMSPDFLDHGHYW
jgi:hypothetical protein